MTATKDHLLLSISTSDMLVNTHARNKIFFRSQNFIVQNILLFQICLFLQILNTIIELAIRLNTFKNITLHACYIIMLMHNP